MHSELVDGGIVNPQIFYNNTFPLNAGERWRSRLTAPSGKRIIGLAIYDLNYDGLKPVICQNTGIGQTNITITLQAVDSRNSCIKVYVFSG